jgi:hypothetical protein
MKIKYLKPPSECPEFQFKVINQPETLIQYWAYNDNTYCVRFPKGDLYPFEYWDRYDSITDIHHMATYTKPEELEIGHRQQERYDELEETKENPWLCRVKFPRHSLPYPHELPALLLAYKIAT